MDDVEIIENPAFWPHLDDSVRVALQETANEARNAARAAAMPHSSRVAASVRATSVSTDLTGASVQVGSKHPLAHLFQGGTAPRYAKTYLGQRMAPEGFRGQMRKVTPFIQEAIAAVVARRGLRIRL